MCSSQHSLRKVAKKCVVHLKDLKLVSSASILHSDTGPFLFIIFTSGKRKKLKQKEKIKEKRKEKSVLLIFLVVQFCRSF